MFFSSSISTWHLTKMKMAQRLARARTRDQQLAMARDNGPGTRAKARDQQGPTRLASAIQAWYRYNIKVPKLIVQPFSKTANCFQKTSVMETYLTTVVTCQTELLTAVAKIQLFPVLPNYKCEKRLSTN